MGGKGFGGGSVLIFQMGIFVAQLFVFLILHLLFFFPPENDTPRPFLYVLFGLLKKALSIFLFILFGKTSLTAANQISVHHSFFF